MQVIFWLEYVIELTPIWYIIKLLRWGGAPGYSGMGSHQEGKLFPGCSDAVYGAI